MLWEMRPSPRKVYCNNTERVALQRRLPDDDAWCVPHNRCLLMFSPSAVNVIAFDALRGADQARCYAGTHGEKDDCPLMVEGSGSSLSGFERGGPNYVARQVLQQTRKVVLPGGRGERSPALATRKTKDPLSTPSSVIVCVRGFACELLP